MTLWEFACIKEGHRRANSGDEDPVPAMQESELAALGIVGFS